MVRRTMLLWPAVCLVVMGFMLYAQRQRFGAVSRPGFVQPHVDVQGAPSVGDTGHEPPAGEKNAPAAGEKHEPAAGSSQEPPAGEAHDARPPPPPPPPPPAVTTTASKTVLAEATRSAYVQAIMDPAATSLPRMECPTLNTTRYAYLQAPASTADSPLPVQYFFALDLRHCVSLLPRLIGSVVETMRFLGPSRCALSIVEGNSADGTGEVLAALRSALEELGVTYHFSTTPIDPKHGDRIVALAQLRNLALAPLLNAPEAARSPNTTVAFLNDVAACPEDILELLHQQIFLRADMVCGMDWTYVGDNPTFYDVWISRTMGGDSFFNVPADGSWDFAWNLFWNDAATQARFAAKKPFQVFSCWNGAAVFKAGPLLGEDGVRFRSIRQGECLQGEPQLFCKDLWAKGFGKVAVVPTVNLEYSDAAGKKIKAAKGYTSRWVGEEGWTDEGIEWVDEPPEKLRCMADYGNQFWEAWNVSLPVV